MVAKKKSKNVSKTLKKSSNTGMKTAAKKTTSGNFGMKSIKKDCVCKDDSVFWKIATIILGVALVAVIVFGNISASEGDDVSAGAEKVDTGVLGENVKSFVEENLIQEGMSAEIIDISEERGVYKIVVNVDFGTGNGQNVTSYSTLDGKYFFATGLDMFPEEDVVEDGADDSASDDSGSPTGEVVSDSVDDAVETPDGNTNDGEPSVAMREETISACIEPFNVTQGTVIFYHSSGCGWCSKMVPGVENLETEGYDFHWAELTTGEGIDLVNQCYRKYITSGGVPQFICTTNANIKVGAFTDSNRNLDVAGLKAFADACIAA